MDASQPAAIRYAWSVRKDVSLFDQVLPHFDGAFFLTINDASVRERDAVARGVVLDLPPAVLSADRWPDDMPVLASGPRMHRRQWAAELARAAEAEAMALTARLASFPPSSRRAGPSPSFAEGRETHQLGLRIRSALLP
jgi:hypothetical protein